LEAEELFFDREEERKDTTHSSGMAVSGSVNCFIKCICTQINKIYTITKQETGPNLQQYRLATDAPVTGSC
jgi:hypothetical protein